MVGGDVEKKGKVRGKAAGGEREGVGIRCSGAVEGFTGREGGEATRERMGLVGEGDEGCCYGSEGRVVEEI